MHLRSLAAALVPLPGGLAADAECGGDDRPADELAGKPVDLAVDGVVELTSLLDECGQPRGRLAAAACRSADMAGGDDVVAGHVRGQRVLSGGLAVAAALSSAHAREPADRL